MHEKLMEKIDYQFKNIDLLTQALSHRSHGKTHNERLEFLGDSIVNCIIAMELYRRFPKAREGQLSRIRANLVNGDTLGALAKEFNVGEFLLLGLGEIKSGGAQRVSILADTMEAIIGSIYLDSDWSVCYQQVVKWYEKRLSHISLGDVHKDPKSLLQELLQGKQAPVPDYELVSTSGEEHAQRFTIACHITLLDKPVLGEGTSRRRAEQDAAQHCLALLGK